MRIWSLHPKYLDTKGLLAVWRESLLAKHVLEGKTKGYTNHPQLIRFKAIASPAMAISQYLAEIYNEALRRGYQFDKSKIDWNFVAIEMPVTAGQMRYEKSHLERKLAVRNPALLEAIKDVDELEPHPMFTIIDGDVEIWEKQ